MSQGIAVVHSRCVLDPENNNNKCYLTNFHDIRHMPGDSYHLNEAGALGKRRSKVAIILNQSQLILNRNLVNYDS